MSDSEVRRTSRIGMVVPTLGERPELLRQTVLTLVRQRDVDLALVLVAPADRVPTLREAFPEVEVIAEPGGGIAAAIEAGWESLGELVYCAWLGDDDMLPPGALAAAAAAMDSDPKAVLVYGRCQYLALDGSLIREIRPGRIAIPLVRRGYNTIAQPGALYRYEAVRTIGGLDRSVKLAFDVDLHLRLAEQGRAVYLPRVLGAARAHPGSLTTAQRDASTAELELVTARRRSPRSERMRRWWDPVARFTMRVAYKLSSRLP